VLNRRSFLKAMIVGGGTVAAVPFARAFTHSIEIPALQASKIGRSPFLAVSRVGRRLVAVGVRGQIALSEDGGANWSGVSSPVSVDLVALHFASEKMGWAVGHGGVVLHTADGGIAWVRQLDGRAAAELSAQYLAERMSLAGADQERYMRFIDDEKWLQESGGLQPFLDVYFEDEKTGYVVGTFNRIFGTVDGGQTWQPLIDRTENPSSLHFNSVAGANGTTFLAGEQGGIWRRRPGEQAFTLKATPYDGTLFGLAVISPTFLLAYGMRGNVFRSEDAGDNWDAIKLSGHGGVTAAARLSSGDIVLVTQAGTIELSKDDGRSFAPVALKAPMAYADVVEAAPGVLILAGSEGLRSEALV